MSADSASQDPGLALGLLTFSRNDVDGVLRNIALLRGHVDEIVVVDSSTPLEQGRLSKGLDAGTDRLVVAPPLGNVDLLRPFGLSRMRSERVLQLDSDERPSAALLDRLADLDEAEAYVVPRREGMGGGYSYHMRLYRRRAVRFDGPSHGFPSVQGRTTVLSRTYCIEHQTEGERPYWASGDRARRYLLSDALERPLEEELKNRLRGLARLDATPRDARPSRPSAEFPGVSARLAVAIDALTAILQGGSLGAGRAKLAEGRARVRFWEGLSSEERSWVRQTGRAVRASGSLTRYLGLDDPTYVDRLATSADGSVDGPSLLRFLIVERGKTGRPWISGPLPEELRASGASSRRLATPGSSEAR